MSLWSERTHHFAGEFPLGEEVAYEGGRRREGYLTHKLYEHRWKVEFDYYISLTPNSTVGHLRLFLGSMKAVLIQRLCISAKWRHRHNGSDFDIVQAVHGLEFTTALKAFPLLEVKGLSLPNDPSKVILKLNVLFRKVDDHVCLCGAERSSIERVSFLSLSDDMARAFGRRDNSDVTFQIGEEVIPAHKWILRARVPYFETLFASGMRETTTNKIVIEDANAESFEAMLKYVYSAKLPEDFASCAPSVLALAEKYGIQGLKDECASALSESLERANAVATLVLADFYGCPELRDLCIKRLATWRGFMQKEEFAPLEALPSLLVEIITYKD